MARKVISVGGITIGKRTDPIGIMNGPNDWTLWLSMSNHGNELVDFEVDRDFALKISPFVDELPSFRAKILALERLRFDECTRFDWLVRGIVYPYRSDIPAGIFNDELILFHAEYSPHERKGLVRFEKVKVRGAKT